MTESVDGYAITSLTSARANIDPLLTAFFIDPVPSDGEIKFRPRAGQSSVATIAFEDLGGGATGSNPSDVFPLTRSQEADMPRSMAVSYSNKNDDYQVGTEIARRIVTDSVNDQSLQLAVVMDSNRAATIAQALLYNDWDQRNRRSFKTTREFAALDAGDVITVEYPRGSQGVYQITRAADDGSMCSFDVRDYDGTLFNTYRLSGLLRGQRGTEVHRGTHVVGERFVVLDPKTLGRVLYDLAELKETRRFKAVTIGQNVNDVASVPAVNTGEGLKPFSPVNLRKTINGSGNTVLTWDRRTRLSENWMLGTVPLGEATEAYNVLIKTLLGVVLFDDTVSTASWTHPSSPTNLTSAIVTVRQVSATYGLGSPVTLTV